MAGEDTPATVGNSISTFEGIVVAEEHRRGSASRRHARRARPLPIVVLGALVLLAGVGVWWLTAAVTQDRPKDATVVKPAVAVSEQSLVPGDAATLAEVRPITLNYIPVVPHVLVHLRPAEIWNDQQSNQELVATLGDLGIWLHKFIVQNSRFEPEAIEELTIAANFGARTGPTDVCLIIRLTDPYRPATLRDRIGGSVIAGLDEDIYVSEELAFLIIDDKTLAVSNIDLAEDLVDAKLFPAVPMAEMETLLEQSDRDQHATVLVDIDAIDVHKDLVFIEPLQDLAETIIGWFGEDGRILSWSIHLQPHFYMETQLTHSASSNARQTESRIQQQLDSLPERLLQTVRQLRIQSTGHRRIVGRFPAMVKALALGTHSSQTSYGAKFTTVLPQIAAANLAAGATLTWNQSRRSPTKQSTQDVLPATQSIADRLKRKLLIDFRRDPLQEAFRYIASEIRVAASIDGDALKLAGFTQNMPQTHDLGEVPAIQALDAILSQYDGKMVIVLSQDQQSLILTTQESATNLGLKPLDTTPQP